MTPRVPEVVAAPPESRVEPPSAVDREFDAWWMDVLAIAGVRDFATPCLYERAFGAFDGSPLLQRPRLG